MRGWALHKTLPNYLGAVGAHHSCSIVLGKKLQGKSPLTCSAYTPYLIIKWGYWQESKRAKELCSRKNGSGKAPNSEKVLQGT